jgi:hypothetical protein
VVLTPLGLTRLLSSRWAPSWMPTLHAIPIPSTKRSRRHKESISRHEALTCVIHDPTSRSLIVQSVAIHHLCHRHEARLVPARARNDLGSAPWRVVARRTNLIPMAIANLINFETTFCASCGRIHFNILRHVTSISSLLV